MAIGKKLPSDFAARSVHQKQPAGLHASTCRTFGYIWAALTKVDGLQISIRRVFEKLLISRHAKQSSNFLSQTNAKTLDQENDAVGLRYFAFPNRVFQHSHSHFPSFQHNHNRMQVCPDNQSASCNEHSEFPDVHTFHKSRLAHLSLQYRHKSTQCAGHLVETIFLAPFETNLRELKTTNSWSMKRVHRGLIVGILVYFFKIARCVFSTGEGKTV